MKPLNKSSKLLTWSYRQNCQILKRKKKKKTYQSNIFNFEPFKSNLKKPKHYQTFRKYIKTQQQINERNHVRRYWETISVKKHSWRHCALVYNFYCKASIASSSKHTTTRIKCTINYQNKNTGTKKWGKPFWRDTWDIPHHALCAIPTVNVLTKTFSSSKNHFGESSCKNIMMKLHWLIILS